MSMGYIFAKYRAWAALALGLMACSDAATDMEPEPEAEPRPDPDLRTTYLDVYLDPGARMCPSTRARLDAEVVRLAAAMGLEEYPEHPAIFFYGDHAVQELCHIDAEVGEFWGGGCADDDGHWIAAQHLAESHELVHWLRTNAGLRGPAYWEEGLATYLGTWRPYSEFLVWASGELEPSRSLYSSEYPDQAGYTEAAHFIAFIERAYGAERLRSLSRSLGEETDPFTAFQAQLGASLEDVEARWLAEADVVYELGPLCDEQITVGSEPVVLRGEIGCNVPGVLGGVYPQDRLQGPRHCFETAPDTTLTVTVRGSLEHGVVQARSVTTDAGCPADEPNLGTNVGAGKERAFDTQGCMWSVMYLSALEGDIYELELIVQ
jgi:hypothetical protein